MSKVTGNFESLIRGVSEQVPHQRYPGQHWAQDNMISDPVQGLVRRPGSTMLWEQPLSSTVIDAAGKADVRTFREHSLYLGDDEYSFMYRPSVKPVGSTVPGLAVVNKSTKQMVPVIVDGLTVDVRDIINNGISSITSVGRFVLMSAANRVTQFATVDQVNASISFNAAVIKQGSYSRTYTLTAKRASDSVVWTVIYTTPASYYPGVLNTSDIPVDANYQKNVNDRVYAYQTAANQWIGSAAAAILPQNIATALATSLHSLGFSEPVVIDNHIVSTNCSYMRISDSGDGSSVSAINQEVESITDLSLIHWPGKVVKITPKMNSNSGTGESFYVRARAIDGSTSGFTKVVWEEAPGLMVTPTFVVMIGVINNGNFYIAHIPSRLGVISGVAPPPWEPSSSGDFNSQPQPAFLGKNITYMRVFQDRLMIVSGSTVFFSRSGDYFNFFKSSAITVQNDDPIEVYALGSEDDVITDGTLLDRDLILFGNVWQYAISGREAMTPQNAYVAIQSSYSDGNRCPPVSAGNLVFFAQPRDHKLTIQQIQTGAYQGTVSSFEVTQQLSKYLAGDPTGIVSVTSPSALFLRTNALVNGVYVYSYLDAPGQTERLFDSWSRWTWNALMGDLVGITGKDGAMMSVTLRQTDLGAYFVLDEFSLNARLSLLPYLDSQRLTSRATTTSNTAGSHKAELSTVFPQAAGDFALIGRPQAQQAELFAEFPTAVSTAYTGYNFSSMVTLTNPYVLDKDGKAILDSRLTLGTLSVTMVDSAAVKCWVQDTETLDQNTILAADWVARAAGGWVLNKQQVESSSAVTIGVYKEIRNCKVTLASRSWLPMGLSAIEWSGQFFTRRK